MSADEQVLLERVEALLQERTGLVFSPCRQIDVENGIRRAMAAARIDSMDAYLEAIASGRLGMDELVAEVTVRETHFFRDSEHFSFMLRDVLPGIERHRGPHHVYRIWSAGCATGEEPYTAAIVLEEAGLADRANVLGTDLCRSALSTAREARYGTWSFRGVGDDVIRRHFRRDGDAFVLHDRVRRRVAFQLHNLLGDPSPPGAMGACAADVIFCRNVLIYLDAAAVATVAARLYAALSPGGWLVTGPSDPPLGSAAPFEVVVTDEGLFYRRPDLGRTVAQERAATEPVALPSPAPTAAPALDPRSIEDQARSAHAAGDWARVMELAAKREADAALWALGVHAAANVRGTAEAARFCADGVARHPLSTELHYLHALLLSELGRSEDALIAVKRVLFLDRSCVVAHLLLATLARARGDLGGARRAYRNACEVSALRPCEEPVPLADGERAGILAEVSAANLRTLTPAVEVR